VLTLAKSLDVDDMLECLRAGAVGYLPGALNGDRLARVIRARRPTKRRTPVTVRRHISELVNKLALRTARC
jgi:hypothetical protein